MKPSRVTVSRSKRGTTIKASGKAAAALFDAMVKLPQANPGPVAYTVHFEDHGQDFLQWDIDAYGLVVASRPFQGSTWCGKRLLEQPKPGDCVAYRDGRGNGASDIRSIRYPVAKVVATLDDVPNPSVTPP